jgi:hypothetical protein
VVVERNGIGKIELYCKKIFERGTCESNAARYSVNEDVGLTLA